MNIAANCKYVSEALCMPCLLAQGSSLPCLLTKIEGRPTLDALVVTIEWKRGSAAIHLPQMPSESVLPPYTGQMVVNLRVQHSITEFMIC